MIDRIRDRGLRYLHERDDPRYIPAAHRRRIERILEQLDASVSVESMDVPGWRLHPLKGQYAGFWAVDVSQNYRIIFRFEGGHATDVDMLDYH